MKTYNNLYNDLCALENLRLAFNKAREDKCSLHYVKEFEEKLYDELEKLKKELESLTYKPRLLKRFIVRDPKTRTIHASAFRDRVVYHALVNIIGPIFDKTFINDSYANRIDKGTHNAVLRFDKFKRKVSSNGRLVKNAFDNNHVTGYVLKADIRHYFDTVDHDILLNIIERKIKDEKVIWLIKQILNNHNTKVQGKGMPLGNLTSQFFANVYLNKFDYFVKHKLKARYYIRYVDDFVILHKNKENLVMWKQAIRSYLKYGLKLELHPDKSNILPLRNGINFLGYRIFYHYKLLRKSNIRKFEKNFEDKINMYNDEIISYEDFAASIKGWMGYAVWANTYKLRKIIMKELLDVNKP